MPEKAPEGGDRAQPWVERAPEARAEPTGGVPVIQCPMRGGTIGAGGGVSAEGANEATGADGFAPATGWSPTLPTWRFQFPRLV